MKPFLSLLLLSISSFLLSQDYVPFKTSDAVWVEGELTLLNSAPSAGNTLLTGYEFRLGGDTLVGDHIYATVYTRSIWSYKRRTISVNMESETIITQNNYDDPLILIGGMRQDIDARKVYFVFWNLDIHQWDASPAIFEFPSPLDEEFLLYDFSLEIDSTFTIGYNDMTLTSIDSIMLTDGSLRKKYNFGNFGFQHFWIEGIGGGLGLLTPMVEAFFEAGSGFFCYSESAETLLSNEVFNEISSIPGGATDDCQMLILDASESEALRRWSVSPQPFYADFVLNIQQEMSSESLLVVRDQLGREIYSQAVHAGPNVIRASDWPTGLYYFSVSEEGLPKAAGRLIKTRF